MPLIEDFLRSCLVSRIEWLKNNPDQIPRIFGVLGKRTSLKKFQDYVKNTDFKVLLGFPREANQVPCFIITLSGEQEVSAGLGDCIDENVDEDYDEYDFQIDTVYMDASYRVEIWSDNADLAVYMYIIAKWAMLVSRKEMLENNLVLPKVSGADLEPVPDYFPIFVFRRALMINFQYENQFFEVEKQVVEYTNINVNPHVYKSEKLQAKTTM